MKKIFILALSLLLTGTIPGQVPASFKYQAVLRDARGNIKANTAAIIIIDIVQGSATGPVVYSETHNVTTDGFGLINLDLGKGTATIASMAAINWKTGIYFIKITVDGVVMGTSQLLSVPYALYSEKAANGFSGNYDDLINKPTLSNGTVTSVTGTSPVNVLTGTTTPVISMAQASGTTNGYLSSTDWTTFNNKSSFTGTWSDITGKPAFATVATTGSYDDLINKPTLSGSITSVSGVAPVYVLTGTTTPVIFLSQASAIQSGYLSSADWLTFNNKSTFDGTWSALTGKPVIDGSETKVIAGNNITVTGTGTEADKYTISSKPFKIGDSYGGGIIFYVDPSGQHGLIAAANDIEYFDGEGYRSTFTWENGYLSNFTGATGDGLNSGAMNTTLIVIPQIGNEASGIFAAKLCIDYTVAEGEIVYGGWYLPSKYELDLLYLQREVVGGFYEDVYWSSTEGEMDYTNWSYRAWYQDFYGGGVQDMSNTGDYYGVRAIRAF